MRAVRIPMRSAQGTAERCAAAYGRILDVAGGQSAGTIIQGQDRNVLIAALYSCSAYSVEVPPLGASRLSINLTPSRVTGGVNFERDRLYVAQRHSMFFTPAEAAARWRKASPSRHLNIYFRATDESDDPEAQLERRMNDSGPVFNVSIPGALALIEQLAVEMSGADPFAAEAVESLARLLLVCFARRGQRSAGARALSARLMGRLEDYVDANLTRPILVADLATTAGLSTQQFAAAFARHTGRTPHQYVLSRRIENASALLRGSTLTLAEVATVCGFANQQHMTHVITQRLGKTPAAARQAALPETLARDEQSDCF